MLKIKAKKIISGIIIFTLLFSQILSVKNTMAAPVVGTGTAFTTCTVGGILIAGLSGSINDKLKALGERVKNELKGLAADAVGAAIGTAVNKAVSWLTGGLLGNVTTQSVKDKIAQRTQGSIISFFTNKNYRDDVLARCLAREILNTAITNALTIARTRGRDGGPTFIQNWTNFQTQAQYRGENIFRAELSTAQLCPYLSDDIKTAYGVDPKKKTTITGQNTRTDSLQPFSLSTKCTMPAGFSMTSYQQDFAGNGGWDAYARMLEPQNNAWGLSALANDEVAKQRALQQSADTNQLIANKGYLGISGNGKSDSCAVKGATGECLVYKDIKTPGSYISGNVDATINAELGWLTTSQQFNSVIANATEVLLNRLTDFSNPNEGSYHLSTGDKITIPGVDDITPIEGNEITACVTTDQKSEIQNITQLAVASINLLSIEDFEDTFGTDRGAYNKTQAVGSLNLFYTRLYAIEKGITDPKKEELVQAIQSWEAAIKDAAELIPTMQWNTSVEKVDIDRQLTQMKNSISAIKTMSDKLTICGATGGGGVCADPGNTTPNYTAQIITAESAVLDSNPTLANSFNTIANSTEFVTAVVLQLKSSGLQASGSVKNGNDVTHTENYVAVWQSGDLVVERYEAVNHAGDGDMTIRNASQAEYSGDIPMTCAN